MTIYNLIEKMLNMCHFKIKSSLFLLINSIRDFVKWKWNQFDWIQTIEYFFLFIYRYILMISNVKRCKEVKILLLNVINQSHANFVYFFLLT